MAEFTEEYRFGRPDGSEGGQKHDPSTCPHCQKGRLVIDRETGEKVCNSCGLVVEVDSLVLGAEYRAFNEEERVGRSRASSPINPYHTGGGNATTVGLGRDAIGRDLDLKTQLKMRRLKTYDDRNKVQTSRDRNLTKSMPLIDYAAQKLKLPHNVRELTKNIYVKSLNAGIVRGRSMADIAGASMYSAIRATENSNMDVKRTIGEIAGAFGIDVKNMDAASRLIQEKGIVDVTPPKAVNRLNRVFSELENKGKHMPVALQNLTKMFYDHVEANPKKMLQGKGPSGIAAAMIYIMSDLYSADHPTQKSIADAARITEVTLRNRYRGIKEGLGIEESYGRTVATMRALVSLDPYGKGSTAVDIWEYAKDNRVMSQTETEACLRTLVGLGLVEENYEGCMRSYRVKK
jgi:transcription initiation factor TFIIB